MRSPQSMGIVVVLAAALAACAVPDAWALSGRVTAVETTIDVPTLTQPRVNPDAGFPPTSTSPQAPRRDAGIARVASVLVRVGDEVSAGQELLRLDDAALAAAVGSVRADAALARTQVAVLAQRIADAADATTELTDKRQEATDALRTLQDTRRTLVANLAKARTTLPTLKANRATVTTQLATATAGLAQLDAQLAGVPPGMPAPAALVEKRGQVAAAVVTLTEAKAKLDAGIAQLETGIPQMESGLVKLDEGIAKVRDGLDTIADAEQTLAEARHQLAGAKAIAEIAVTSADLAVLVAEQQRSATSITAPTSGIVVAVATIGDVLAPGATAVVVRDTARTVETWIAPERAADLCLGDPATVRSGGATLPGRVVRVGAEAEYPPAWVATSETHLVRAVRVTVALDPTSTMPNPGTPVDLTVTPCRGAHR